LLGLLRTIAYPILKKNGAVKTKELSRAGRARQLRVRQLRARQLRARGLRARGCFCVLLKLYLKEISF
jgi:hypothetical protein